MPLQLMYITNRPEIARIAQDSGVDYIFVDMEYIGKQARQTGDTVKSNHTIQDIRNVRSVLDRSQLLVRVNPITPPSAGFVGSKMEIEQAIQAGADVLMLPMAKSVGELEQFITYVDGRAKTMLLLETPEAVMQLDSMLQVTGLDRIHIGLNDLHLAYRKRFMFQLLTDGTVEKICKKIANAGLPYGFGGIARIGLGMLPSEYVIAEHYRLGSSAAILSRSFCNANKMENVEQIREVFLEGVRRIRQYEDELLFYTPEQFEDNRTQTKTLVENICKVMEGK